MPKHWLIIIFRNLKVIIFHKILFLPQIIINDRQQMMIIYKHKMGNQKIYQKFFAIAKTEKLTASRIAAKSAIAKYFYLEIFSLAYYII